MKDIVLIIDLFDLDQRHGESGRLKTLLLLIAFI